MEPFSASEVSEFGISRVIVERSAGGICGPWDALAFSFAPRSFTWPQIMKVFGGGRYRAIGYTAENKSVAVSKVVRFDNPSKPFRILPRDDKQEGAT